MRERTPKPSRVRISPTRRNVDDSVGRRRNSSAWLCLALCALAMLAGLAIVQPAGAQTSEEFAFRIAARVHPNGTHLEFGIQRLDHDGQPRWLHLEQRRFVALDLDHNRWLRGDATYLRVAPYYDPESVPTSVHNTRVRVVARLNPTRDLFEFGAQYELGAVQLPRSDIETYAATVFDRRRFFPNDVDHHRWFYTGEFRFTRVWSGGGSMEQEATMEDDGSEPEPGPQPAMSLEMCLIRWDPGTDAMTPEECNDQLEIYCEGDPEHPSCVYWQEQR